VSRIFDAIRRVEQAKGEADSGDIFVQDPSQPELPTLLGDPRLAQTLEPLECNATTQRRLVLSSDIDPSGLEKFRYLAYRLQQLRQKRRMSTVLVTSAIPKEGKTVVAVNLALVLARHSKRVLLVDADLRRPAVHSTLGASPSNGLADVLEGREKLLSVLRWVNSLHIFVLPAGSAEGNLSDLLHSQRLRELLTVAAVSFDWVIIDSPPINLFADPALLASLSDAILMVVRSGLTPKQGLDEAVAALEGAFIAGVVLNADDSPLHTDYYSKYKYKPASNGSASVCPAPQDVAR
jgi:capsular exopolysaccharide synthesis family protein